MHILNVKRTLYPVGQGCFYSEILTIGNETKTIVYDCGSENLLKLDKEIDQAHLTQIDYLIISHFHKDHINGIEKLKRKYKIHNVIIPKIEMYEKVISVLHIKEGKKALTQLIMNPKDFFGGEVEIIEISTNESDNTQNPINIEFNLNNKSKTVWCLKFFLDKVKFEKLNDDEKSKLNSLDPEQVEKKLEEYRNIYSKISTDINLTSLSMASYLNRSIEYYPFEKVPTAAIFNGDIRLIQNNFIDKYFKHFHEIISDKIIFHIPHHGSHHNMSRPISEFKIKTALISSGYNNKHGHPSGIILRIHKDKQIVVYAMTEFDMEFSSIETYKLLC